MYAATMDCHDLASTRRQNVAVAIVEFRQIQVYWVGKRLCDGRQCGITLVPESCFALTARTLWAI